MKEPAFWPFAPLHTHVLPESHVLLDTGNKIINKCWDFAHDRIEMIPRKLVEKKNTTIMSHIALKRSQLEIDRVIDTLNGSIEERKQFNHTFTGKLSEDQKLRKE